MIDTSLNSPNFYFLLAVFQGIILAGIIIFRQPIRKTNLFFGLLVFFFSLTLLHFILEESISSFNSRFPVPMEFSFLYGPLAYFHILYIKNPKRIFSRKDLLHFLPSLLLDVVLFTSIFLFIRINYDWAEENTIVIQVIALSMALLCAIQLSIYTFWIYRESVETKHVLRDFKKVRKWVNFLIASWGLLIGFLILAVPVALIFIEYVDSNSALLYKPLDGIIGLFIYFLGYLYLTKYARVVENYTERITKFGFSAEEMEGKKHQILQTLTEERLYRDSKLSIAKLAGHLNWPINSVSTIINESLQTNFNDLISQYRVMEFKERVMEPDSHKYSIVGLGQEVGFSSKASFYRAFKKETGMTPSDFIKSQA